MNKRKTSGQGQDHRTHFPLGLVVDDVLASGGGEGISFAIKGFRKLPLLGGLTFFNDICPGNLPLTFHNVGRTAPGH